MDIIIYVVDIQEQHFIDESMIDRIYDKKEKPFIYVVINKIDIIEEEDIAKQFLDNIRIQASNLINKNRINKYFETSALTGEGIENLTRHLKIDSYAINLGGTELNIQPYYKFDKLYKFQNY